MIPVYQVIINSIQERIQKGEFVKDDKLPSEAGLMAEFSTSRITVTRALKELELKGVIYRIKGKGSFVKGEAPNRRAGNKIISLVLPHKEDFYSGGQQYARQVSMSCQEAGYLCSLHYSDQSTSKEKQILEEIAEHEVAGAIIYPISNRNISTLSRMSIQGFPMVFLDRKLDELSLPVVASDNFNGAYEEVAHICAKGHKRIAFVGAKDSDAVSLRYKGYCRALTDNGIPLERDLLVTRFTGGDEDEQSQLDDQEALEILQKMRDRKATALFCVNDLIAMRFLNAADKLNISIPDDLSIAGFDNMNYLPEGERILTTVAQDFPSIARHCVSIIINMIENGRSENQEDVIVPTAFIEGNTTGLTN